MLVRSLHQLRPPARGRWMDGIEEPAGREREETGCRVPWGPDPGGGGEGGAWGPHRAETLSARPTAHGQDRVPHDELPCPPGTLASGCSALGRTRRRDCWRQSATATSSRQLLWPPRQRHASLPRLQVCSGCRGPQNAVPRAPEASGTSAWASSARPLRRTSCWLSRAPPASFTRSLAPAQGACSLCPPHPGPAPPNSPSRPLKVLLAFPVHPESSCAEAPFSRHLARAGRPFLGPQSLASAEVDR